MWRIIIFSFAIFIYSCHSNDHAKRNTIDSIATIEEVNIFLPQDTIGLNTLGMGKEKLSQYGFFTGSLQNLRPSNNVFSYTLNSTLFSDYAEKARFIYIPEGKKLQYLDDYTFSYPEGSVLIKNFYYRKEDSKQIIETRLLTKEGNEWIPIVAKEILPEAFGKMMFLISPFCI